MGKSLRSKRMRKNRRTKRTRYGPKELEALKTAVQFEYNEQTESKHLSIFHNVMNGPPPYVPGLEEGSKLQRAHLTEIDASAERHDGYLERKLPKMREVATRALTKSMDFNDKEKQAKTKDSESMEEVRIFNPKTLKDQYGNYPTWMNKKKVLSRLHAKRVGKQKLKRKESKLKGKRSQPYTDVVMDEVCESD